MTKESCTNTLLETCEVGEEKK